LRACYARPQLARERGLRCAAGAAPRVGPGTEIGTSWVIPQLRWLHELSPICPAGAAPDPAHCSPPLDFGPAGLANWPGAQVGYRLRALRHPPSMELAHNRLPAWTALLGENDQRGFSQDVTTLGLGLRPGTQLGPAPPVMNVAPWLEAFLSVASPLRDLCQAGGATPGPPMARNPRRVNSQLNRGIHPSHAMPLRLVPAQR
jgi:hypothetical protein